MSLEKIYRFGKAQVLNCDVLEGLKSLEDESIDICVSSPPYWGLRDYGVEGQIGLESTFQEYVKKIVGVYSEVKRVLKSSGTCFLNIGDTYASNSTVRSLGRAGLNDDENDRFNRGITKGIIEKNLCMIPERVALGMQEGTGKLAVAKGKNFLRNTLQPKSNTQISEVKYHLIPSITACQSSVLWRAS